MESPASNYTSHQSHPAASRSVAEGDPHGLDFYVTIRHLVEAHELEIAHLQSKLDRIHSKGSGPAEDLWGPPTGAPVYLMQGATSVPPEERSRSASSVGLSSRRRTQQRKQHRGRSASPSGVSQGGGTGAGTRSVSTQGERRSQHLANSNPDMAGVRSPSQFQSNTTSEHSSTQESDCPFPRILHDGPDEKMEGSKKTFEDVISDLKHIEEMEGPVSFRKSLVPRKKSSKRKMSITWTSTGFEQIAPRVRNPFVMFQHFMNFMIVANSMAMFIQLDMQGTTVAVELGVADSDRVWTNSEHLFVILEHVFNTLFVIELIIHIYVQKWSFLFNKQGRLNTFQFFDVLLVGFCSLELWIMPALLGSESGNLSFIRLIRLIRLTRGLRVIRVMKIFSKLRILVNTVACSFMALVWSMVMLGILMFGAAVFMCQQLQNTLAEDDGTLSDETKLWIYRMYGTSSRAIWTMFEFTFSGGWPNYARTIVEEVHWGYGIFFALYVQVVVFACTRIITALFMKDTLQVAASDADMMVRESMERHRKYSDKLKELFELADHSKDGFISMEEFQLVCSYPEVIAFLHLMELEIGEVQALFHMLDDGTGAVSYQQFTTGILRLKGQARSMDVIAIMRDCAEINQRVKNLEAALLAAGFQESPELRRARRVSEISRELHDLPGDIYSTPAFLHEDLVEMDIHKWDSTEPVTPKEAAGASMERKVSAKHVGFSPAELGGFSRDMSTVDMATML